MMVKIIEKSLVFILTLATITSASGDIPNRQTAESIASQFQTISEPNKGFDSSSTLDDYLAYAALHSLSLKRAFYNWKAALEKTGYVGALPDPLLSYGYFIENVETKVGPQNQRFSLKQSFPWFGTLGTKKDIAQQQANAAYRKYQAEKLKLFYTVKSAYYDYYYLGRDISITNDNFELLKFWEAVARTKYKVALRKHPDIIKAQVELGKFEDRLLSLQDKRASVVARLRAVMNLPDSVDLPIPRLIRVDEVTLNYDSIITITLKTNPDLEAMLHIIDKEQAGVKLAGKMSLPSFTIGVDYIATGPADNPDLSESGKDPWIVGVGIKLPIWFGKNNARKREAQAKLRTVQYNYHDARNQLTAFVEDLMYKYADALRKVRLYRDGLIPKAEQALNASYTAYEADEMDFLNVLDAQRELLNFQLSLEKSLVNLATSRAAIEMVMGSTIDN